MYRCLFGMETEYAIGGVSADGYALTPPELLPLLLDRARTSLPSLRDSNGGVFLANGSRLYGDCGSHPELCTPECTNPWDVVRYVRAGERMLVGLLDRIRVGRPDIADLWLLGTNVSYGAAPTTWGCHESYLSWTRPVTLAPDLVPHLASRVIFTGAGGFNPRSAGIEFTLSPRAVFFDRVLSGESTSARGIFHTKDEPLASGAYHRVHVIYGESLRSDLAAWLKVGTTALVIAMIDNGVTFAHDVELASTEALGAIAADPDGRIDVPLASGKRTTALGLQRHYLAEASRYADASFMPRWAPAVIRAWSDVLNRIERRDGSLHTMLDWAIKQALCAGFVERRGIRWSSLRDRRKVDCEPPGDVRRLRAQLLELDTKFGRLGPAGVFSALDRRPGVLAHRLADDRPVEDAVECPPGGRAHVRGTVIRRLAGRRDYVAAWNGIAHDYADCTLDLSDPFGNEERWITHDGRPLAREELPAASPDYLTWTP